MPVVLLAGLAGIATSSRAERLFTSPSDKSSAEYGEKAGGAHANRTDSGPATSHGTTAPVIPLISLDQEMGVRTIRVLVDLERV